MNAKNGSVDHRFVLMFALLALVLAACPAEEGPEVADEDAPADEEPANDEEVIELQYAAAFPAEISYSIVDQQLWEEVEQRSDGRVSVSFSWGGAILGVPEMLEGTGDGLVDIGYFCAGSYPAELPLTSLTEMPYLTREAGPDAEARMEMFETWEPFRDEYLNHNVMPVWFHPVPPTIIGVNRHLDHQDEVEGLRVRAYGDLGRAAERLGMTPVSMETAEMFESLDRDLIQGYIGNAFYSIISLGFAPVTETVFDPGMGNYATCGNWMNVDTWENLPDDIQGIIHEVANEAVDQHIELIMEHEDENVEMAIEENKTVLFLDEDDWAAWEERVNPSEIHDARISEAEDQGLPGEQAVDMYVRLAEEFAPDAIYVDPFDKLRDRIDND